MQILFNLSFGVVSVIIVPACIHLLQLERTKCGYFLVRHLFWFVRLPTPTIPRHLPHAASFGAKKTRKVLTLICMRYKYGKSWPWFSCATNTENLDPNCLKQGKRSPTSHARSYRPRATNIKFLTLICMCYKHGRPSSLVAARSNASSW